MIRVSHYHRKKEMYMFSIERLFSYIRASMPDDIKVEVWESTFVSRGLWRRLYNMVEAIFRQGEVNHITGDVHFLTLLLNRKRTLLTIHDCVSLERLRGFKKWLFKLLWYTLPVNHTSVVTVISESTKWELLKYVNCDPKKIFVIYDCISEEFCNDARPFNESCPKVLQIGTGHNKNIERVSKALESINCRWSIIGPLTKDQIAIIERHGIDYENHVRLTDEELLEQYKFADMLVFASTYEGFGMPILEANAIGRPVVTSNLYSMPEVAGNAACLVDPYDVASIRAGIMRIIEEPNYRETLITAGFCNVERFRPNVIAEQYSMLYRNIVGMSN